jgi:hypothetical protein
MVRMGDWNGYCYCSCCCWVGPGALLSRRRFSGDGGRGGEGRGEGRTHLTYNLWPLSDDCWVDDDMLALCGRYGLSLGVDIAKAPKQAPRRRVSDGFKLELCGAVLAMGRSER